MIKGMTPQSINEDEAPSYCQCIQYYAIHLRVWHNFTNIFYTPNELAHYVHTRWLTHIKGYSFRYEYKHHYYMRTAIRQTLFIHIFYILRLNAQIFLIEQPLSSFVTWPK